MTMMVFNVQDGSLRLRRFDTRFAGEVAGWVESKEELGWLAPSTTPPVTADKVARWCKGDGRAFLLVGRARDESGNEEPALAYGELNRMQRNRRHCWLGHMIVRPKFRGLGVGRTFVRWLVREAVDHWSAERITLVVFPGNLSAIRCYRGAGFELVGEEFHRFQPERPAQRLFRMECKPSRMQKQLYAPAATSASSLSDMGRPSMHTSIH